MKNQETASDADRTRARMQSATLRQKEQVDHEREERWREMKRQDAQAEKDIPGLYESKWLPIINKAATGSPPEGNTLIFIADYSWYDWDKDRTSPYEMALAHHGIALLKRKGYEAEREVTRHKCHGRATNFIDRNRVYVYLRVKWTKKA